MPPNGMPDEVRVESNFGYPVVILALGPGITLPGVINIDSAADFLWIKSTYQADIAGAAQTDSTRVVPNVDVQIQLGGADKNLFQAAVPIPTFFGTGQEPGVMAMPQRLQKSSTVNFTLTSREAANTLNIRLVLLGWKDYGYVQKQ